MKTLLLQEDDCAPDAREYFIKEMREKFGLNFSEFFSEVPYVDAGELRTHRIYKGHYLEFNSDDPYYRLYKGDPE